MKSGFRLRTLGIINMIAAFSIGLGASWAWFWSVQAWNAHLSHSYVTGIAVHEALRIGAPMPVGVVAELLPGEQQDRAERGEFSQLPGIPTPSYVTNVSILAMGNDPVEGETLTMGILSDSLRYSISELVSDEGQSAAEKFGNVTRLLAAYCSEPVMFVSLGGDQWWRIDGTAVWGCDAAPRDLRLLAVLIAGVALAVLGTAIADTSAHFDRFARALRSRRRLGGPESYSTAGPAELREIVAAVNLYLEKEREQLLKRAMILSGVSHDLGTPATRLRLRAALIKEQDLREQLEADIDSMTGMIESVLTYTRAEMSAEEPRQISLTSLVEALVDDYKDMGKPVELRAPKPHMFEGGSSVFTSHAAHGAVPDTQRMLVMARPISLQRAISNLVDNALKYGRRASVELRADADHAIISVEDEGSGMSTADIEAVIAPFKRGSNTTTIEGSGLGLTIVSTVAEQHGGQLHFETSQNGLRACLEISRT